MLCIHIFILTICDLLYLYISLYLSVTRRSHPVIHVIRDMSIEPQYIDLEQHNCKGREGVW